MSRSSAVARGRPVQRTVCSGGLQLYLWGLQFTDIESRTHHSEGAIRRYLADFRQIAAPYARGAKIPEMRGSAIIAT